MSVLDEIVASKRKEFCEYGAVRAVERGNHGSPTFGDESSEKRVQPMRGQLFLKAMAGSNRKIIGEIKPRSPSAGTLTEKLDLDGILETYEKHCSAISVLTDEKYFGGGFDLLEKVASRTSLPLLCKDFIVHKDQIKLAAKCGAHANLLIVKILSREELRQLIFDSRSLGLEPVIEINNEDDLLKCAGLDIKVFLINNRNLDTMEISLDTTEELAELLPPEAIVISASGISKSADIERLSEFANCFLIGTALMKSQNSDSLLNDLRNT